MSNGLVSRLKNAFKKTKPTEDEKMAAEKKEAEVEPVSTLPSKFEPSVGIEEANKAKEDLRLLVLEKEIVSYALTHLYEAEAEGKITKDERTLLVNKYKDEMKNLDSQINKKQMIVKLRELEEAQSELMKMFHDKLNEINTNIEDIRTSLGISGKETQKIETPTAETAEGVSNIPKEKKTDEKVSVKAKTPPKTKTDEKMEAIQEEVLKVLERLEQMETEA